MAQRRMISLDIVDTDAFLDMPISSQALYFHLNTRADDDGFVANPKKVVRMIGTQEDDLKVLVGKKFVLALAEGVCVIKHWRINNFIRKDIYKETKYLEQKKTLFIRPNGTYSLRDEECGKQVPMGHYTLESLTVNATLTPRELRVGKGSKGKVRIGKRKNVPAPTKKVEDKKTTYGEFNNVRLLPEEYIKLTGRIGERNTAVLIAELDGYIESKGKKYRSHYATLLNWARRRYQEGSKGVKKVGKL